MFVDEMQVAESVRNCIVDTRNTLVVVAISLTIISTNWRLPGVLTTTLSIIFVHNIFEFGKLSECL